MLPVSLLDALKVVDLNLDVGASEIECGLGIWLVVDISLSQHLEQRAAGVQLGRGAREGACAREAVLFEIAT